MKKLLSLLLFIPFFAVAQPKIQQFKLNEVVVEKVAACKDEVSAIEAITDTAKNNESIQVFLQKIQEGKCGVGTVMVVYKKRIIKVQTPSGDEYSVYEAVIVQNDMKIYVLVKNFSHEVSA